MYPVKQKGSELNSHISSLELERLSDDDYLAAHPLAQELEAYTIELKAGDSLYIPPYWWHHVHSLDSCVSVPLRFTTKATQAAREKQQKESFKSFLKLWKEDKKEQKEKQERQRKDRAREKEEQETGC